MLTRVREKTKTFNGKNYVFSNRTGKPYSKSAFSKFIKTLFMRFTGKDINISLLRKIYISSTFPCDLPARRKLAKAMQHSVNLQASAVYSRCDSDEFGS